MPGVALNPFLEAGEVSPKSSAAAVFDFLTNWVPMARNQRVYISPLDQIRATPLYSSPVGLVNAHFWGYNIPEKINTSFAINPNEYKVETSRYWFPSATNSNSPDKPIRVFRPGETYIGLMEEIFNTAAWITGANPHGEAAIVVELHDGQVPQEICTVVKDLYGYGFRYQTFGNELDLPWDYSKRNRQGLLEETLNKVRSCSARYAFSDLRSSPAGPAYYGYPSLRQEPFLQNIPRENFEFITLHLYPPVNDLEKSRGHKEDTGTILGITSSIDQAYQVMQRNGWTDKELILRELGFPGVDHPKTQFSEDQLAEGHMPAMLMLSIGSKKVSRVFWFNFCSMGQDYQSLASFIDGKWVLKPTFDSWEFNAKLLAQLEDISILSYRDYTLVKLRRKDGIEAVVGWANGMKRVVLERPEGVIMTNAYGIQRFERQFILDPSLAPPTLTGSARYMLKYGHLDIPQLLAA